MRLKESQGPESEQSKARANAENELYKGLQNIRQSTTEIRDILTVLKPILVSELCFGCVVCVCVCVCVCVNMCACLCSCVCVCVCYCVCVCVTQECVYVCVCMRVHLCVSVYVCVCGGGGEETHCNEQNKSYSFLCKTSGGVPH